MGLLSTIKSSCLLMEVENLAVETVSFGVTQQGVGYSVLPHTTDNT
jgi:hypothetical protein